jgi:predicted Zn finger-like uncharacterized protein
MGLEEAFLNQEIELSCPECGRKFKVKLKDVRNRKSVRCTCGTTIKLEGKGLEKLLKSLRELEKGLGSF